VTEKNGCLKDMVYQFRENWLEKILKLASEKSCCKATLEQLEDEASTDDNVIESGTYDCFEPSCKSVVDNGQCKQVGYFFVLEKRKGFISGWQN
jgi:hypothetical protein